MISGLFNMEYYVYRHIRLDSNTPFYIGKGKDRRAYTKSNRSHYWKNIVSKHGYRVEILKKDLEESQAFKLERKLIKVYKMYGYCEVNFTEGGDGISGFKFSKKSRSKMSKAQSGKNNPMFRKTHSIEVRNKISKYSKNRKRTLAERKKLSNSRSGICFTDQHKINLAIAKGSKLFEVYRNNTLIGTYINKSDCMRDLGLSVSSITRYLNGDRKHKEYIFKIKD